MLDKLNNIAKKITLVFVFIFLLSICGTGQVARGEERVVTDMIGRKVELPNKVERVVTTYKPATQFILALGAQDRLVAGARGMPLQILFTLMEGNVNQLPKVGSKSGINLEAIVAQEPDLVITDPHRSGPQAAEKLKKQGIATIIIKPESFQQIKEANRLIGSALNLPEKAQKINDQYDKILKLTERVKNLPQEEKKKVYFANSSLLDTVGGGMLQTDLIEMAGAINPAKKAKKGFMEISPEQLIKWNPDTVIISQFYRGKIDKLLEDEKYQSLKAFKDKNIYRIPSQLEPWDFPSPSSPLIAIWLAEKLYPEKYEDVDLEQVINDFYKKVYGQSYDQFLKNIE